MGCSERCLLSLMAPITVSSPPPLAPVLSAPALPLPKSLNSSQKSFHGGSPGGAVVKNLPANAGDKGSSPGPGRSHMPRSN